MRQLVIVLLCLLILPLGALAQDAVPQSGDVVQAQKILQEFNTGDFAGIYAQLSDEIKAAVTEDQLGQAWQQIVEGAGAFVQVSNVSADAATHDVVLTMQFEKAAFDLHLVFDPSGSVVGLRITPSASTPTQAAPTPTYADTSAFTETAVTVGDLKLPGTITMPNGAGPFAAVVLISGSGPEDQDETIGPNKPFRDIAWGLAAQGIATLRFDKSTFAAPDKLDIINLTVKEEYVDDSVAAIELMRTTEGIDPARVFVLGHSEGGYILPRIAAADPNVAGLIIASGLANPIPETIVRQYRYILSLSGTTPDATEAPIITDTESAVNAINALTADSSTDQVLLYAHPAYWLDLRGYDPVALAATLAQPILVLQGERDYQVTMADDFVKWQAGLADHADTTFKTYPDLNHLYTTGTGMATPAEYGQPGNVAEAVIDDIAVWVKGH